MIRVCVGRELQTDAVAARESVQGSTRASRVPGDASLPGMRARRSLNHGTCECARVAREGADHHMRGACAPRPIATTREAENGQWMVCACARQRGEMH